MDHDFQPADADIDNGPGEEERRVLSTFELTLEEWRRDPQLRSQVASLATSWDQDAMRALERYVAKRAARKRGGLAPEPVGEFSDGEYESRQDEAHAKPHGGALRTRRSAPGKRADAAARVNALLQAAAHELGHELSYLAKPFPRGRLRAGEKARRADLAMIVVKARKDGATLKAIATALELPLQRVHDLEKAGSKPENAPARE